MLLLAEAAGRERHCQRREQSFDKMREIQDLMDVFPYCLLVALPIMIFLSPTAIAVGHEFPAHRLAQFELGGIARGPKGAALSLDARALSNEANVNLLRKTIVARLQGMTVITLT